MALPASQYSVLDAKRIERIDDDTFRCYVGGLRLFNFVVEPVLTVSVIVTEKGPTVKLLSTEVSIWQWVIIIQHAVVCTCVEAVNTCHVCLQLEGSRAVVAANDKFTATMSNDVRWGSGPAPDLLELRSDTTIQAGCFLSAQCIFLGLHL